MNILLRLFVTFFKVGIFTFGGGYAMISVIEDACVKKRKWLSYDEMMNIIVVAESTPGPISVNTATYVGFLQKGFVGACFATLGLVLPSFIIIYLISMFFERFLEIQMIANAFNGIKIGVGIMIFDAGLSMFLKMNKAQEYIIIFVISFVLMLKGNIVNIKISSIMVILLMGLVGVIITFLKSINFGKLITKRGKLE